MSYDVRFKIKDEETAEYLDTYECEANTTWNARQIIVESTGLEWKNNQNNGLCKDVIPHIRRGIDELVNHSENYRHLEAPNKWGTIDGTIRFFNDILDSWEMLDEWLQEEVVFWIE